MAPRKLKRGYYTYKGKYLWLTVIWHAGECDSPSPSGVVTVHGAVEGVDTALLKTKQWGRPYWMSRRVRYDLYVEDMTGGEFNRRKWRWRKVKADKVPYVWRKFLNRIK